MSLYSVSIGWICFYIFHSLLAADHFRAKGEQILGGAKTYRFFYSTFSLVTFSLVIYLILTADSRLLLIRSQELIYVGLMMTSLGIIVFQRSFKQYSLGSFLGLVQESKSELVISGIHRYVRHPIYTATLLVFMGAWMFNPTDIMLITFVWLCIYLPIGIHLEEKKLINEFGDAYVSYKKKVKALIPRLI